MEGLAMAEGNSQRHGEQPSTNLVERARELRVLGESFDRASRGAGGTVMVCGSAGMGKTSLLRAFLQTESLESATVFHGGCDDLIAPRSFGPFRDMADFSRLLPDELVANPNREDLLAALLAVLDRPSCPAVIAIEDTHWADDASIDVMRYLARRIVSMHTLMIITLRDEEIPRSHPIRRLFTGPTSSAPLRIDLRPLSLEAVASLAQNSILEPEYVHAVSGGNPFLVRELLAANHEDATRSAQQILVARGERLTPEARAVLQVLSVLPEGADPSAARSLFGDDPEALHEAEGSGLLESTTDRIRFHHELGRNAIVSSMSFSERMAATNKVLSALMEIGADPTSLVHISRAAGDGRRATRFALDVLENGLAPNSYRETWQLSRIALECTADLTCAQVADLHQKAAWAGRATNNLADAVDHAAKAIVLLEEDGASDEAVASARLTLAIMRRTAGDNEGATVGLQTAMTILDDAPVSRDWVKCNSLLAASAFIGGDVAESIELATESIETAEANEWMQELVYALGLRGIARWVATPEGEADLMRAIELGEIHGPTDRHAANLHNMAVQYWGAADLDSAERYLDTAERCAQEHRLDYLVFHCHIQRAHIMIQRGRLDEAEAIINNCMPEAPDPGAIKTSADAAMARILSRRGDPRADQLAALSWSEALATGESQKIAVAGITRMEHLWLQGEDDALGDAALELAAMGKRCRHYRLRAEALRHLQRLGHDVETFEHCPPPFAAALSGRHRQAAELWDHAGQPYDQALELLESQDTSIAFEGLRLLDRTGATRTADLIRQRLRMRGFHGVPRGPRKSSGGVVPVLTDRQVDVLKLVAKGLTNQEIADELFVARRTVDNHVSAILSRLGVDGRHEAVEEATARGLVANGAA